MSLSNLGQLKRLPMRTQQPLRIKYNYRGPRKKRTKGGEQKHLSRYITWISSRTNSGRGGPGCYRTNLGGYRRNHRLWLPFMYGIVREVYAGSKLQALRCQNADHNTLSTFRRFFLLEGGLCTSSRPFLNSFFRFRSFRSSFVSGFLTLA